MNNHKPSQKKRPKGRFFVILYIKVYIIFLLQQI